MPLWALVIIAQLRPSYLKKRTCQQLPAPSALLGNHFNKPCGEGNQHRVFTIVCPVHTLIMCVCVFAKLMHLINVTDSFLLRPVHHSFILCQNAATLWEPDGLCCTLLPCPACCETVAAVIPVESDHFKSLGLHAIYSVEAGKLKSGPVPQCIFAWPWRQIDRHSKSEKMENHVWPWQMRS